MTSYESRAGICMNEGCESADYPEAGHVTCTVDRFGTPVCGVCGGDKVADEDGIQLTRRDFIYAI